MDPALLQPLQSTALKTGQNGPFWPILATLACLTPSRPFFGLDLSRSHHWTFTLGCGEVISGQISLDPALLGLYDPQNGQKWPIFKFGCCGLFDTWLTVFLLDLIGSHFWTFTLGCGDVVQCHILVDPAFLQPLQPSKQAKMAHFGYSGLFDTHWILVDLTTEHSH